MKVALLDYDDEKITFEIGNLDDIYFARIDVISGDEIMTVTYKDGTEAYFDSSECRTINFNDGGYPVYIPGKVNLFENKKWLKRKSSYDRKWMEG